MCKVGMPFVTDPSKGVVGSCYLGHRSTEEYRKQVEHPCFHSQSMAELVLGLLDIPQSEKNLLDIQGVGVLSGCCFLIL